MKIKEIKRIAAITASMIGDTERDDLYIISGSLIGFKTMDAAKVLEYYMKLEKDEFPHWEESLKNVDPVYFSESDNTCHTASDFLDREEVQEALSVSGQETQKETMWFMPLFENISHIGNISSKCFRMVENLNHYFDRCQNKQITLGVLKLTINLLLKASHQYQENIEKIRNQLIFTSEMQLNFEGKKLEILRSEKRHIVPNIDNFFKMRKHIQKSYVNPLNWYFRIFKDSLKGIQHSEYQMMKHQKEARLSNKIFDDIIKTMNSVKDVIEERTETP